MAEEKGKELDLENPIHLTVHERILQLEAAFVAKDPMIKNHLGEIHKAMIQHEEIVHLLKEDQIEKIFLAQQRLTSTTLTAEVKPKSKSTAAKAAKLGMDDL